MDTTVALNIIETEARKFNKKLTKPTYTTDEVRSLSNDLLFTIVVAIAVGDLEEEAGIMVNKLRQYLNNPIEAVNY